MTAKEIAVLVTLWVVVLKFLGHEIHSAWLIHKNKQEPPKEIPKVRRCLDCASSEIVPFGQGSLLCKVTGLLDPIEVCELYEERIE